MKDMSLALTVVIAVGLLTLAGPLCAQAPAGLWSSTLYRVELQVSGGAVSGSFTPLDDANAPPGRITGRIEADGRAFKADWTFAADGGEGAFTTLLNFADRDGLLTGYRWSEDSWPTAFALRRAVNGQIVEVLGEDDVAEVTAVSRPLDTPAETQPQAPAAPQVAVPSTKPAGTLSGNAQAAAPGIQVIVCENAVNGEPVNVSDQFTAPKSIAAMVRYSNLPPDSTVSWLWTLDGRTEAQLTKTFEGTGWHMHGMRSETALVPGAYQLVVSLNGRVVAQRTVTVRPAGKAPAPVTAPAGGGATAPNPSISVTVCESVVDGEAVKPGTQFTRPRSLACLVKYRNLPANTELKWVWQLPDGKTMQNAKTVTRNGWAWHGLNATPALPPGTYKVTIHALGQSNKTINVTVR